MTATRSPKLKLLALQRMLVEETDAEHGLTMAQIIERLAEQGIAAERKGIYRDIKTLQDFGVDVVKLPRRPVQYAVARDFSLSELTLLVDAVASCKSLTSRQTDVLIGNIKSLASDSEQDRLERRIHVARRVASEDGRVFAAVDAVHRAMAQRRCVVFRYLRYGADGERHADRGGAEIEATPLAVSYDEGFYYLTAWDEQRGRIAEFRLDRADGLRVSERPATRNDETAAYAFDEDAAWEYFGRFDGPARIVTLRVRGDRVEIVRDRFGDRARITPDGEDALAVARVRVSPQFFGWVAGLDGVVTIEAPAGLVEEYRAYLRKLLGE